ncbi:MAG: hypothetical protein ACLQRM_01095 [Acidimicrobiales bacterium]
MTKGPTPSVLAHLYRRAGFGATQAEIEAAEKLGFEGAIAQLIAGLTAKD